jgi:hypothetical protein
MKIRTISWAVMMVVACGLPASAQSAKKIAKRPSVNAGSVLSSVFDVSHSSRIKSRSLMQRTFLDTVGKREQALQVAFVIDGTDSMGADIQGVLQSLKSMVGDLQRHKSEAAKVSYGLVVYRDVKSPSGAVQLPMGNKFTSDLAEFEQTVASVKTESGAPYFEEAVDVGLNDAFSTLSWSEDADTVRWVIIFGDAPPYPENFDKDGAKRVFTNDELIQSAKSANAIVHCVLCSSGYSDAMEGADEARREKLRKSYETSLSSTRAFMGQLTEKTAGVFLDLSREDMVATLLAEAKRGDVAYQSMEPITAADVEAARTKAAAGETVSPARVAVLPHLPLKQMKFDGELPGVQVATMMREKLRLLPNVEVKDVADVTKAFEAVKSLNLEDRELLQKLATDLRVDYVVWGSQTTDKANTQLKSAIYRRLSGTALAEAEVMSGAKEVAARKDELAQNNLIQTVTESLLRNAKTKLGELQITDGLAKAYDALESSPAIAKPFSSPLSSNLRASREVLAGLSALEQAVALQRGNPAALHHLEKAKLKLGAAALLDPTNPLIHAWLATAHYNTAGDDPESEGAAAYRKALEQAHANIEKAPGPVYRSLIEAQYVLAITHDGKQAIDLYESLLSSKADQLDVALKAHWMLAGIYAGDWGAPEEAKNPAKAREHIIQILANWSDSKEAEYLKDALRWDDQEGTRHPHLPLENANVVAKVD